MARNLIMGTYYCALSHAHSSADEVQQCNKMEEERQKRDHEILKQNKENTSKELNLKQQRLDIEQLKQETENLKQKQDYEKHMAELELMKLQIERDKKKIEHEEKMANLKLERQKQKNVSRICVLS